MRFFPWTTLIFSLILAVFAFQNSTLVLLSFLGWDFTSPLSFIIVIIFLAGFIAGIIISIPTWWRTSKELKIQRKRIFELEK